MLTARPHNAPPHRHKRSPVLSLWFLACLAPLFSLADTSSQKLDYKVLQQAPHDARMFTQGLVLDGDFLVETGGGYGQSSIRRYYKTSGEVVAAARFPAKVFAEGLALTDRSLFALTWQEGICYELEPQTLALKQSYAYDGEGWGLTYDGKHLIMSDGSDRLTFRRTSDFGAVRQVTVTDGDNVWSNLNELEFAEGWVWANVWQDSRILAVAPQTGAVQGILDLSDLVKQNSQRPGHSVLNGIAYDEEHQAYWVTGKLWPNRYLIEIIWPATGESGNRADPKPVLEPANDNRSGL
jgi:glutamine cyclotransferase